MNVTKMHSIDTRPNESQRTFPTLASQYYGYFITMTNEKWSIPCKPLFYVCLMISHPAICIHVKQDT